MADVRFISPRRTGATIYIHPAEIVDVICQQDILKAMTEGELKRAADNLNAELLIRANKGDTNEHTSASPEK